MSKSLSELKSSPDVGLPERTFPLCVSGKLVAELEAADSALYEAETELTAARVTLREARVRAERRRDGEEPKLRSGQKSPAAEAEKKVADLEKRAEEAAERSDAIRERMVDHTIDLHLRGKPNGEWRQWVMKHPSRDEDTDPVGAQRDKTHAAGFCNIDALIADLGGYDMNGERRSGFVVKYGGEEPSADSWEFVSNNAAPGDLTRLASTVVAMHEQVVDLGKSRTAWRNARTNASASASR